MKSVNPKFSSKLIFLLSVTIGVGVANALPKPANLDADGDDDVIVIKSAFRSSSYSAPKSSAPAPRSVTTPRRETPSTPEAPRTSVPVAKRQTKSPVAGLPDKGSALSSDHLARMKLADPSLHASYYEEARLAAQAKSQFHIDGTALISYMVLSDNPTMCAIVASGGSQNFIMHYLVCSEINLLRHEDVQDDNSSGDQSHLAPKGTARSQRRVTI